MIMILMENLSGSCSVFLRPLEIITVSFGGEYWVQDGKNIFVELISKPLICNIFPEPSAGIKPPLKNKNKKKPPCLYSAAPLT